MQNPTSPTEISKNDIKASFFHFILKKSIYKLDDESYMNLNPVRWFILV
jgi:hypothetical protein